LLFLNNFEPCFNFENGYLDASSKDAEVMSVWEVR
jgi:hypothetical protein